MCHPQARVLDRVARETVSSGKPFDLLMLYFGGTDGVVAFDPGQITDNTLPPPMVITAMRPRAIIEMSWAGTN